MVVFKLLEQTGRAGAREPLADIHPSVQPEGGGHHAPAPGQDAPASETHRVSALSAHPSTHCWPTSVGPGPAPAVPAGGGWGHWGGKGTLGKHTREMISRKPPSGHHSSSEDALRDATVTPVIDDLQPHGLIMLWLTFSILFFLFHFGEFYCCIFICADLFLCHM